MKTPFAIFALIISFALLGCGDDKDQTEENKIVTGLNAAKAKSDASTQVIYGDDNRLDLYQVTDERFLKLADSTLALIFMTDVEVNGAIATLKTKPYKNGFGRYELCPNERFRDQDTAAFCSGFLVAPNVIATAGHCVQNEGFPSSDCSTSRFVFGFNVQVEGKKPTQVPISEVYYCKRIIKRQYNKDGADFSLVELDRAVPNHTPLKLRSQGEPAMNDELTVLGHPAGLPLKVAGQAKVRGLFPGFIRASLDTYGGNSGSAVINSQTLEVEGVLVRGETDFILQNGCMASKVCAEGECRGEDVTRISEALPFLGP